MVYISYREMLGSMHLEKQSVTQTENELYSWLYKV